MTYRGRCEGRRWRSAGASEAERKASRKRRLQASLEWAFTEHAEAFRKLAEYERGEDVPLSPRAQQALDEGLESARRG